MEQQRRISANINSDSNSNSSGGGGTNNSHNCAGNPPRCMAIYFSTHKIVKRIALVFSNIYRFVCSSFAVVVCVVLRVCFFLYFVRFSLHILFYSLVVAVLHSFTCRLYQNVHDLLIFPRLLFLLCGRVKNHSDCKVCV